MTQELAEQLLNQAEELIGNQEAADRLLEALNTAEKTLPEDVSILCRGARLLFRYGILNSKGRFFLLALDKLKMAQEKNPSYFETNHIWWQLWGNILIHLGKFVRDLSFIEEALEKYARAARAALQDDAELFWDWAEGWRLLGQLSGEVTDLQQALAKFHRAFQLETSSVFLRLDYAGALVLYGSLLGDPAPIEEALALLREGIVESYSAEEEVSIAYAVAWRKTALTMKMRYELTHKHDHFEEADRHFREAITATPKNKDLWLDWGELYLYAGWARRDLKLIETALEKLTSSSVKECEPLRVSTLLGMGLVAFGLFLENLKLIKDGQERVRAAYEAAPQHPQLTHPMGFIELGMGLYFSDEAAFARAAALFEEGIQEEATATENWHALFQTYLAWGLAKHDLSLVKKGVEAIARLCKLRPFSPLHLNEWGVALLRCKQLESDKENQQARIEEAIDKFRKSWQLCEDEETLYNWGTALDLLGNITGDEEDYSQAIEFLSRALEKKPTHLHIRYHLGLALSHLGELTMNVECLAQAQEILESVARVDHDDEIVWCDLGYALLNLAELVFDSILPEQAENRRSEAERALQRAAELGSGDACYHLACLYSLTGLYDTSMHYLKKAATAKALPSLEDLERDEWLDGVRKTEAFQDFLVAQGRDGRE